MGGNLVRDESRNGRPIIKAAFLGSAPISEADLEEIGRLTELEELTFVGTGWGGKGLRHLHSLTKLRSLALDDHPISDSDLADLPVLPELEKLRLVGTLVTDAGVEGLKRLPRLREINLGNTRVTGASLKHFAKFPSLVWFWVPETRITREEVERLHASLPHLRGTWDWALADSPDWPLAVRIALARVRALGGTYTPGPSGPAVSAVSFFGCAEVGDADLAVLRGFEGLKLSDLDLRGTAVTDAGANAVQARIAGLKIKRGPARE